MAPQREYLCPAAGEYVSIECSTNYTVLKWSIKFSFDEYSHSRFVTHSSNAYLHGWISSGDTAIKYSKNSEPRIIPLISSLMISNVSDLVDGIEINCTGLQSDMNTSFGERILMMVLYIVTPPEVSVFERFGTTNLTLNLIWIRENNDVSYNVSTEPPAAASLIITGDTIIAGVQLIVHYNTLYNASIVAYHTHCNAATTTIGFHYCKFL